MAKRQLLECGSCRAMLIGCATPHKDIWMAAGVRGSPAAPARKPGKREIVGFVASMVPNVSSTCPQHPNFVHFRYHVPSYQRLKSHYLPLSTRRNRPRRYLLSNLHLNHSVA